MSEFLLEIGTEEIPAGYIEPALEAAAKQLDKALRESMIGHGEIKTFGTPRRLIIVASDVETTQQSREIEKAGPPKAQAYDAQGNPTKAAVGFARSQGVDVADLVIVETSRGEQVAVRKTEEGRASQDVLSEILPSLIERIPFPKSMRWMDLDVRFVRPIHWIVAILDGETIPFSIGNIQSGNTSRGHRFTHPAPFEVSSVDHLRTSLAERGVVIDPKERAEKINRVISELAAKEGLEVSVDQELLDEVTYLVESPYPVMGQFPEDFLELPASILITCMKKHQRYFSVQDGKGRITNRFIAVNNTPVTDPQSSVRGHQRVLKARLEDARFYFREDRKSPLIDRIEALKGVVFHSKLGTSYEKVQRFTHLARNLAESFAPDRLDDVERAALLSKCDLETGIVYEFPELQGIIGSYYARMDGEGDAVSAAVREHYLPAHAGDRLPEGIIGSVVSLADRIDTIAGCFCVGLIPTGAADPYGLRRHAFAVIQILIHLGKPLNIASFVADAVDLIGDFRTRDRGEVLSDVMDFIRTRFVNFHTGQGFPLDVVEAAVRARFDDLLDARLRLEALDQWKQRDDFDAITTGFKRVVNILKNTEPTGLDPELLEEEAEKALFAVFTDVRERAGQLIESGDYAGALQIIAELGKPIDTFFDDVMVMVEDETLRDNRLGLLRSISEFFNQIADFSFIGSTAG
jgi:glycyl-tRNA synthetase beta chain